MKPILFTIALCAGFSGFAQHAKVTPRIVDQATNRAGFTKSEELTAPCQGLRKTSDITELWMRGITSGRVEPPGHEFL